MIPLETSRLHLRGLQVSDVSDIFEYCQLPSVMEMVGMRLHPNIDVTSQYVNHELKRAETHGIVVKNTHKLIGTVSLRKQYNESNLDIRSITCVINPKYWGNGYAPEAIKELIKYAFEELKVHKIIGGYYSFNKQSKSVNKKIGFVYEGTNREVRLFNGKLVDEVQCSLVYKDYLRVSERW